MGSLVNRVWVEKPEAEGSVLVMKEESLGRLCDRCCCGLVAFLVMERPRMSDSTTTLRAPDVSDWGG